MRSRLKSHTLKLACIGFSAFVAQSAYAQVTSNFNNLPTAPKTKPGQHPVKKHAPTTYHRPTVKLPQGTDPKTFASTPLPPRNAPVKPVLKPLWMPEGTHPDVPAFKVEPDNSATTPVLKMKPAGYKVCFAPQKTRFNKDAYNFLVNFGSQMGNDSTKRIIIRSYATGAEDDPSLPRRMAFARGLDARSILMNQGVPATRIYAQTFGLEPTKTNCPDRLEILTEQDPIHGKKPDDITALISPSPAQREADKHPVQLPPDPALTPNVSPFKAK